MQVTPYSSMVASVPESAACMTSSTINDSDMLAERGWQEQMRSALGKTIIPVMVRNSGDVV